MEQITIGIITSYSWKKTFMESVMADQILLQGKDLVFAHITKN